MHRCGKFYWYRGETIERFGNGWIWMEESCRGYDTIPIYKALKDARNAISAYMDSTNDDWPRVIGTAVWVKDKREWVEQDGTVNVDPDEMRKLARMYPQLEW